MNWVSETVNQMFGSDVWSLGKVFKVVQFKWNFKLKNNSETWKPSLRVTPFLIIFCFIYFFTFLSSPTSPNPSATRWGVFGGAFRGFNVFFFRTVWKWILAWWRIVKAWPWELKKFLLLIQGILLKKASKALWNLVSLYDGNILVSVLA